jgi:hypothetical protein
MKNKIRIKTKKKRVLKKKIYNLIQKVGSENQEKK